MPIRIVADEKEGHRKVKTNFRKKHKGAIPKHEGEEAAVYDVKKTKGNSYNATNRELIRKLKGGGAKKGKAGEAQTQWF